MIVLLAKYYLTNPADLNVVISNLELMKEQVLLHEPGCRLYQVAVSSEHDNLVLLYEHYANEEALLGHRDTPHFKKHVDSVILPLLDRREREVYELVIG